MSSEENSGMSWNDLSSWSFKSDLLSLIWKNSFQKETLIALEHATDCVGSSVETWSKFVAHMDNLSQQSDGLTRNVKKVGVKNQEQCEFMNHMVWYSRSPDDEFCIFWS